MTNWTMNKVKRATKGQFVKVDMLGNGTWAFGVIAESGRNSQGFIKIDLIEGGRLDAHHDTVFKSSPEEQTLKDKEDKQVIIGGQVATRKQVEESPEESLEEVSLQDIYDNTPEDLEDEEDPEESLERASLSHGPLSKIRKYKYETYKRDKKTSKDNGDKVAQMLRGKDLTEAYDILAEAISTKDDSDKEEVVQELTLRYSHLNPGHQRMCIGNRLRKIIK